MIEKVSSIKPSYRRSYVTSAGPDQLNHRTHLRYAAGITNRPGKPSAVLLRPECGRREHREKHYRRESDLNSFHSLPTLRFAGLLQPNRFSLQGASPTRKVQLLAVATLSAQPSSKGKY